MDKKRIIIFIVIGVLIVACAVFNTYFFIFKGGTIDQAPEPSTSITVEPSVSETMELQNSVSISSPLDVGDVISVNEINTAIINARSEFRALNVAKGDEIAAKAIKQYGVTDSKNMLNILRADAAIVQSLPYIGRDRLLAYSSSIKDAEMIVVGIFTLDEEIRPEMIIYKESLAPIYKESIRILSSESVSMNDAQDIWEQVADYHPLTSAIYKVKFMLDGINMEAYVIEEEGVYLSIYKFELMDKTIDLHSAGFMTVSEYIDSLPDSKF